MDELRFIDFGTIDVYSIMSINEALFRKADESGEQVGFLWDSDKTIIMGYSQLIERELELERCRKMGYEVTRRISGGGMAFSSAKSQIQYGFIGSLEDGSLPLDLVKSYERVCGVVIHALDWFGLKGEFKPINDVLCNGKKISGSAQTRGARVLLQHGTLLVNFNIKEMLACSNIPLEKISDKGIKTVEERLTDLRKVLGRKVPLSEAREAMRAGFEKNFSVKLRDSALTREEEALAKKLLPKYHDGDWVFRYTRGRTRSSGSYPESLEQKELGR